MLVVTARLAPGRAILPEDFLDLTPIPVTSVAFAPDGRLAVTFESDIDPPVARRVRWRILSVDAAEELLRAEIFAAGVLINSLEPITAPTVVKVLDRLELLARQVRLLTRLTLRSDDEADRSP